MVVGKPYIHFKINNEPIEEVVDYNYTWATTVEAKKGPINTPIYISSAAQAQAIFGIDMRPYFAQGPQSLIMVRVAALDDDNNVPTKGAYSFKTESDIIIYRAQQLVLESVVDGKKYQHEMFYIEKDGVIIPLVRHRDEHGTLIPDSYIDNWKPDGRIIPTIYNFISYADANGDTQWGTGTVSPTGIINGNYTEIEVKTNEPDPSYIGKTFFVATDADENTITPVYNNAGHGDPLFYVSFSEASSAGETPSEIYTTDEFDIRTFYVPEEYYMNSGTVLFEIESEFEGEYDISVTCGIDPSDITGGNGYRIVISQGNKTSLIIRNASNVEKIVNRINDSDLDVTAKSTIYGEMISVAMQSYPISVTTQDVSLKTSSADTEAAKNYPLITNTIINNSIIGISQDKTNPNNINYLTEEVAQDFEDYQNNRKKEEELSALPIDYTINLRHIAKQSLIGGSNGPWDIKADRISQKYQASAHKAGLDTLRRIRLAGIFCMYGEEAIQYEYQQHGIDSLEPEKGMNNNETCKWRTILLGANAENRSDISSLANKAKAIDNQYVLFLGQGLIDTGMTGVVSTLSKTEKKNKINAYSDNHLLPYECTQYIAGLRSKLNYGESIFGGQGRKRIRGVGDLDIAPLTSYDDEYVWDPNNYTKLNEAGVLTFTEDYGQITLTDGVTTIQHAEEEDEEGVMNILKYAQNAIYDVCLPYIGRNIDADLENSITTAIEKVLEEMKVTDMTLIDTEEYPAYDVSVVLNSRKNQLLGRIYVYVLICPVHAVRQIEVEMTVQ